MKAIVYRDPPDFLKLEEIEKPTPGVDEVLIKVRASSAKPADLRIVSKPLLRRIFAAVTRDKVRRPGIDVAGEVEAVGGNVVRFKPGDEVFGAARGAFAEYACAAESKLALKPANITFEEAASVPVAALTALQGLRDKGHLQAGQTVLINGAAGGVGTYAVQIAKALGANVTGVCSAKNVEMVRSLGADCVIDYSKEDFTKDARRYDLILDNVGNHPSSLTRRLLNHNGTLVIAGAAKDGWSIFIRTLQAFVLSRVTKNVKLFIARARSADLEIIADLMAAGKVTAVIDRRYRLSEVPEALRYVQQGHARAKVVISLELQRHP
jgi:NADPH:quinone reductase-like Zn-dependent oxidoreductase